MSRNKDPKKHIKTKLRKIVGLIRKTDTFESDF